jgi:hypothetical protein
MNPAEAMKALANLAGNSTRLEAISRQTRISVGRLGMAAEGKLKLDTKEMKALCVCDLADMPRHAPGRRGGSGDPRLGGDAG